MSDGGPSEEPSRGTSRAKTYRFPPMVCWPELSTSSSPSSFWQPGLQAGPYRNG
jgi:hypothetical protein